MATTGQTDFSEHAVDAHAPHAAQGMGDGVQQWRQEGAGWREYPDSLARQCSIDCERDQEARFAPASPAHQDNAAVIADEIERLDLRWMQRRLRQDDRIARRLCRHKSVGNANVDNVFREPAHDRASRLSGIAGLALRPRHKGRPRLVCEPLDGRELRSAAIEDAGEARRAAVQEIRGDRGRNGVGEVPRCGFELALEGVRLPAQRHGYEPVLAARSSSCFFISSSLAAKVVVS